MESSGIGGGENATQTPDTGTQAPQQEQGPDLGQFMERFESFAGEFGNWRQGIDERFAQEDQLRQQQEMEAQQAAQAEQPPDYEQYYDDGGVLSPEALDQWVDSKADQKVKEALTPIQQQLAQAQQAAEEKRIAEGLD